MGDKRKVQGIVIGLLVLTLSVSFVSAGFLDIFKFGDDSDLEGELASDSADITLTITDDYDPPEIVYVSDLNYLSGFALDAAPSNRDLSTGTPIAKTFYFYVYSPSGIPALPLAPAADEAYIIVENMAGKGLGDQRKSGACTGTITTWNTDTDDCDGVGTYCTGPDMGTVDVVRYDCSVNFQHYENPTIDNWRIYAYIEDLDPTPNVEGYDGTTDEPNSIATPIRTTEFNAQTELEITDNTLNFGSLGFGVNRNQVPIEGDPSIQNIGNVDITQVDLTAYNIPDQPDLGGDYYVYSSWFYTDPDSSAQACDSASASPGTLTDSSQINTGLSSIVYGSIGTPRPDETLYICLDELILSGNTIAGTYSTTPSGTPWNIQVG